jgi:hypothetical protein
MTRQTRLSLIAFVVVASAVYAALVAKSPEIARTIMLGYIGIVLTIFVANELWRKP